MSQRRSIATTPARGQSAGSPRALHDALQFSHFQPERFEADSVQNFPPPHITRLPFMSDTGSVFSDQMYSVEGLPSRPNRRPRFMSDTGSVCSDQMDCLEDAPSHPFRRHRFMSDIRGVPCGQTFSVEYLPSQSDSLPRFMSADAASESSRCTYTSGERAVLCGTGQTQAVPCSVALPVSTSRLSGATRTGLTWPTPGDVNHSDDARYPYLSKPAHGTQHRVGQNYPYYHAIQSSDKKDYQEELQSEPPVPDPDYQDCLPSHPLTSTASLTPLSSSSFPLPKISSNDNGPFVQPTKAGPAVADPRDRGYFAQPRKVHNTRLVSKERQALHKELLLNHKLGIDVLQKPELTRVMEQRKESQKRKEWAQQMAGKKTSLELKLEQQANKLREDERLKMTMDNEKIPEFQQIFHRINHKMTTT